jgi:hypothetical protein
MATNKVVLSFYKQYEPAMVQSLGNSSPKLEYSFNEELGLKVINVHEMGHDDYCEFEIVDEKLWMLAVVKYGF